MNSEEKTQSNDAKKEEIIARQEQQIKQLEFKIEHL